MKKYTLLLLAFAFLAALAPVASAEPFITSLTPTNMETMVRCSVRPVATFDVPVREVAGGKITLSNLTAQTSITITIPSQQVIVTNNTLEIRPAATLNMNTTYAVLIGASAIEDLTSANFAGISDPATWQFETTDDINWSLIAYWPLNDGPLGPIADNTVIDDVIDYPDSEEVDGVTDNSTGAFVHDAEKDRMVWQTTEDNRLQAGKTQMNRNFTWACWAKSIGNDDSTMMGTRSGSYARFFPNKLAADGYSISWTFNGTYNDDQWHHFVFQRDVDTFKVYVDGAFDSQNIRDRPDNLMQLELGGSARYKEDFNGYMYDIAIWDEVLDEERIQELAAGGPVIIPPPSGMVLIFQ